MNFVLAPLVVALALAHPQPAWVDCSHHHDVRPAGITIACADGNFWVNRLTFKTWGRDSATAVGVGHLNDCDPNCAAGHFHAERISIRLSHVETCGAQQPLFSEIAWTWSRRRPAWWPRGAWNGSQTSTCTWLRTKR